MAHGKNDSPTFRIKRCEMLRPANIKMNEKKKKIDAKEGEIEKNRSEWVAKLNLTENEKYWFELANEFLFLKGLRKDVVFFASRCVEPLLREIAKRLESVEGELVRLQRKVMDLR